MKIPETLCSLWACLAVLVLLTATRSETKGDTVVSDSVKAAAFYHIEVELFGMDGRIEGREVVSFADQMESPLDSLCGIIWLQECQVRVEGCESRFIPPEGMLNSLGQELRVFQFPLDKPLQPGKVGTFVLHFSGRVPSDEKYHAGAVAACWFWYPVLTDPRTTDWSNALTFMKPAGFEIQLTVPGDHAVAVSAESRQDSLLPDGRKYIVTRAARDYQPIWISSANYQVARAASPGGQIEVYYSEREARQGPFVAQVAAEVSTYYSQLLGMFPFPTVSLVPGRQDVSGGGNAGPRILMLHQMHLLPVPGDQADTTPTRRIVAHELGHLYWSDYLLYGPESADFEMYGLGLGMWTDQQYTESLGAEATIEKSSIQEYMAAAKAGYNTNFHQTADELKAAPFDVNHVIRHGKSFAVVSMLEYLMGKETFRGFLQDILRRYHDEVMTERGFILLAQEHYGADLQWFFDQWMYTNKVLDYGIGRVDEVPDGVLLEVRRVGEAIMPVIVQVSTSSGTTFQKRTEGRAGTELVRFDGLDSPWRQISLDPGQRLPDVDRTNNAIER